MIIIYEPQCKGNEHSDVNASILVFLSKIENNAPIKFFGEPSHLLAVKQALDSVGFDQIISTVSWHKVVVPNATSSIFLRIAAEMVNMLYIVATRLYEKKVNLFCVLSCTSVTLFNAKLLKFILNIPTLIVLHGILEFITQKPVGFIKNLAWFRNHINLAKKSKIKYLTTAEFIKSNLIMEIPSLEGYVFSIEFPYIFHNSKIKSKKLSFQTVRIIENITTFTMAGIGTYKKGTDKFFTLPESIDASLQQKSRFIYAGKLNDEKLKSLISNQVETYGVNEMLSSEDYSSILHSTNYLLFFYPEDSYRFGISGVFLDALKYEIPIIALRNDMFTYVEKRVGDVGWICHSVAEIESVVRGILANPPLERIKSIKNNYIQFKTKYTPEFQSEKLKKIINNA